MVLDKSLFFNREIGLLNFNERVLAQAEDARFPLLERVKFLNIFNSNLDEFFMKRVGGLQRQFYAKVATASLDGLNPEDQLRLIRQKVLELNDQVRDLMTARLLPELRQHGIHILNWDQMEEAEKKWASQFFRDRIFPVLTPMAVDPGHPFPLISNLSSSLAISLQSPNEEDLLFARIKIPDVFPAWLRIPNTPVGVERFISCTEVIEKHLGELFPRMTVRNTMAFRVTRNIDIETAIEEDAEDLLELIEEEVRQRRFAEVVRLEHGPNPDPWLLQFLTEELDLSSDDIYVNSFPLEYKSLQAIASLNMSELKFKPHNPVSLPQLADESANIFSIIRNGDLLIHHPYENFSTSVERFIQAAAADPDVVALKMTLYRTSEQSPIVHALIRAAEAGKQVVCLVELKARLDEERNIYWAQAMERAGVHVVYGIVGLKTHAKITLVVRQEKDEFRSYAHIGTGNYHSFTAKLYTDFGLLTCRPEITSELIEVFHYLTGRSLKSDYRTLLVSPINARTAFIDMIHQEAQNARQGLPSGIVAKMNNLEDRHIIEALYQASQAGVKIKLLIRGFSCLRPGIPGISENIEVVSIIGPFLEHSRVFYFRSGQPLEIDGRFYIGSADWMTRNLHGRVEVVAPVSDKAGREKIWEALDIMWNDQRLAWDLDSDGNYEQRRPDRVDDHGCHEVLADRARVRLLASKSPEKA